MKGRPLPWIKRPGWWLRTSILLRLTIWHSVVVGAITLALGLFVYGIVEHRLHSMLDREMDSDLRYIETRLQASAPPLLPSARHVVRWPAGNVRPNAWFEVWNGKQELLLRQWPPRRSDTRDFLRPPWRGRTRAYSARPPDGTPLRVLERPATVLEGDLVLRIYRNEMTLVRTLRQILFGFVLASPIAALLSAMGGYSMARRALAQVGAMAERARRITSKSLSQRLPAPNPHDELGQLAGVFNETLARLEDSFLALRRFTADASHELRTPLSALRAVGEVALRSDTDEAALRETVASMLEESARLDDILEALLTLARAEGAVAPPVEDVHLAPLLADMHAGMAVLAADRDQRISIACDRTLVARGNRALLRQAVMNLLHNAVRHSNAGGTIELSCRRTTDKAVIEVADEGPGIAPEHQQRIFERFFRVDKARSRAEGGHGLGLAIAKLFVEQQGGQIQLESEIGKGSRFRIVLDLAMRDAA